jgi:hypothetical protein
VLRLSAEANERVLDLERRIEPRLAPEADLGHISDWASKLTGATTRLTALLYAAGTLRTGWAQPIPATDVDAGARLGHYFLAHALAVFDTMSADPIIDDARAVLDWIIRTNQFVFSRRDAFSGLSRSRFRRVVDLDPGTHPRPNSPQGVCGQPRPANGARHTIRRRKPEGLPSPIIGTNLPVPSRGGREHPSKCVRGNGPPQGRVAKVDHAVSPVHRRV